MQVKDKQEYFPIYYRAFRDVWKLLLLTVNVVLMTAKFRWFSSYDESDLLPLILQYIQSNMDAVSGFLRPLEDSIRNRHSRQLYCQPLDNNLVEGLRAMITS